MRRKPSLVIFLAALAALAACSTGTGPEQALVPTSTLAPIVSLTPRFTATPVASRTPLPTFTYTPTESPIPPTPSDTPTPSPTPPVVGVIQSQQTVNVREGPGTNFGALTSLAPGTGVEVIGVSADGDWTNILMEDGSQGWVSSRLLFVQPTATALATFTPTVDQTAIALGTTFPTAILGGAPVSPTPPPAALGGNAEATEAASAGGTQVIDLNAFNMTATALVSSITGDATARATTAPASGSSGPVGGPTGGPVGGPTPTLAAGAGQRGQTSSQSGVDVLAYCDTLAFGLPAPRNLNAGATIDIYWSWYARTRELLQDHIDNVIYDVSIDGTRLTNWRLYAAQVTQQEGNWYQYWFVPYGPLTSGEHVIQYRVTWREAISDGYEDFGPGTSNPQEEGSCTFTVN
jgi:hypothetical protein